MRKKKLPLFPEDKPTKDHFHFWKKDMQEYYRCLMDELDKQPHLILDAMRAIVYDVRYNAHLRYQQQAEKWDREMAIRLSPLKLVEGETENEKS